MPQVNDKAASPRWGLFGSLPGWAWFWLTVVVIGGATVMMGYWVLHNRHPVHWDEAEYLNPAYTDANALQARGWGGLVDSMLNTYNYRPPGYRFMALPAVVTQTVNLSLLRFLSIAAGVLGLGFLYRAVARLAGPAAGAVAALCLGGSVSFVSVARLAGNESLVYLAIAASMYYLFRAVSDPAPSRWSWIGLGTALAIGLTAKLSFPFVIGPMLLICFVLATLRKLPGMLWWQLLGACLLGGGLAAPWYLLGGNWVKILWLARQSQTYQRNFLDGTVLYSVITHGFGWPVFWLLVVLGLAGTVVLVARLRGAALTPSVRGQALPLLMCLAGAVPFAVLQLGFSSNTDVRVLSPVFLPLIAGIALLAGIVPQLNSRFCWVVVMGVSTWQFAASTAPANRTRLDFWTYERVYEIARTNFPAVSAPRICFLGNNGFYNREAIKTAFLEHRIEPSIDWLWGYGRELNWTNLHASALDSELVLVPIYAPAGDFDKAVKFDVDNSHNAEFDLWLRESGPDAGRTRDFIGPIVVMEGHRPPVELHVYVRAARVDAVQPLSSPGPKNGVRP